MPKLNFYDTDAVKAFTLDARSAGTITAKEVDQEIKDALDLLTMSQKTEGGATK